MSCSVLPTSLIKGPCSVARIVIGTSSAPATLITSSITVKGRRSPSTKYPESSICSSTRSVTSGPRLVTPQPACRLCPERTAGTPGKLIPAKSKPQASETVRQCIPIWYQSEGMAGPRWGSLTSRALPVAVCAGPTAQELDPTPSPTGPISVSSVASMLSSPRRDGSTDSSASAVSRASGLIPRRAADPPPSPSSASSAASILLSAAGSGHPEPVHPDPDALRIDRSVNVERAVDDGPLRHDHRVLVVRESRVQLRGARATHRLGISHAVDLVLGVASQVPGDCLGPRQGVDRGPWFDVARPTRHPEQEELQTQLRRAPVCDVGVHTIGVGLQHGAALTPCGRPLLLGQTPPPHRAQVLVGVQARLPNKLCEAPRCDVPVEVHLPEPVLGVHVALREEQVLGGVGVDVGDAVGVAHHGDGRGQPRDVDGPGGLRVRAAHHPGEPSGEGHAHHQDEHQEPDEDLAHESHTPDASEALPSKAGPPGRRGRVGTSCTGRADPLEATWTR